MLKPLGDRVLVQPIAPNEKTAGGLIIPPTAQEKYTQGTVMAVGTGLRGGDGEYRPMDVEVGQTVLLPKYNGTEVKLDGETYVILRESEILGVME